MHRSKIGSMIIGTMIVAGMTLTLGLVVIYLAISWTQAYSTSIASEFDKYTQFMRAAIVIEAVSYSDEKSVIYVRNVSKYDLSVSICRIELYSPSKSLIVNATPSSGIGELVRLSKSGDYAEIEAPTCPSCGSNEALIYRVWYTPSEILEKAGPSGVHPVIKIAEAAFVKKIPSPRA